MPFYNLVLVFTDGYFKIYIEVFFQLLFFPFFFGLRFLDFFVLLLRLLLNVTKVSNEH